VWFEVRDSLVLSIGQDDRDISNDETEEQGVRGNRYCGVHLSNPHPHLTTFLHYLSIATHTHNTIHYSTGITLIPDAA